MEIYRQRSEQTAQGLKPTKVILSSHIYHHIQMWHASLGIMQNQNFEYITKDSIFSLEICLDNAVPSPQVT